MPNMRQRSGAVSIQPKIPKILVGSTNGTDHFGLGRPEYSGPSLKVTTVTGLAISVGRTEMSLSVCQNCCPQYRSIVSCLQEQVVSNGKSSIVSKAMTSQIV